MMIKKQLLKISLTTFLIAQQALASQTELYDVDTTEELKTALHNESYNVVEQLMQRTAQRTAKSELDRACDELIIWTNSHPFDQEKYDQLMRAIFAAEKTNMLKK